MYCILCTGYYICAMYYVLCAMYYVLCAMCYVLCAMCYVLCTMYYVPCTMYYNVCPVHYLLSPIQLYIHESAGPIQHVYVGQVGKKLNVSQLLAQLRKSFITTVTSSQTNTRRSELT